MSGINEGLLSQDVVTEIHEGLLERLQALSALL